MSAFSKTAEDGASVTAGAAKQLQDIMDKLAEPSGLPLIVEKIEGTWVENMESIRTHIPGRDTARLKQIATDAYAAAHDLKKKHFEDRAGSWSRLLKNKSVLERPRLIGA